MPDDDYQTSSGRLCSKSAVKVQANRTRFAGGGLCSKLRLHEPNMLEIVRVGLFGKSQRTSMTLILGQEQLALISAALRHVRDAEFLLDGPASGRSLDQAYHLAGYGPECVRKATFSLRLFDKIMGHQLGKSAEDLLEVILSLDPWPARYYPLDWESRFPELVGWRESCRYEKTNSRNEMDVRPVVEQARRIVDEITLALWADGRIPGGLE